MYKASTEQLLKDMFNNFAITDHIYKLVAIRWDLSDPKSVCNNIVSEI